MNINIKLISILHGILFLHFIGRILMRSGGGSRRSKNAGGVIIAGLALTLLGYFGYLFGRMIQSAVSRQREYLADASAVQYTRNPQGIAGALKKIGGFQQIKHARSILGHQKAQQVEHMMFSVATTPLLPYFLPHFFATHPPITKRIQAIDPTFSPPSEAVDLSTTMDTLTNSTVMGLAGSQASEASHPTPPLLAQERQFLNDLDPILRKACHHPQKAKALLYLLTTEFSESSIAKTHQILTQKDPYLKSSFDELKALIQEEHIKHRIELFDLCMPSLRRLSVKEYKVFLQTLLDIVHADQKVLFSEWIFVQLIRQHLHQYFFNTTYAVKYKKEIEIIEDLKILFSAVAYAGHSSFTDAQIAFDKGFSLFDLPQTTIFEQGRLDLDRISTSFTKLQHASSHIKTKALKAMEQIVLSDDEVTWEEYELFRALSDGLGNPTHPKMM